MGPDQRRDHPDRSLDNQRLIDEAPVRRSAKFRAATNSLLLRRAAVFRWDVVWQNLFSSFFLQAAWTTLWISVVAQICGFVLDLFIAFMLMSRVPLLS